MRLTRAAALLLAAIVLTTDLNGQGTIGPVIRHQFLGSTGVPLNGAKIYTYLAGTANPEPIFTDLALSVAHPNPAVADSAGRLTFYCDPQKSYKYDVRNSADVSQYVVDNVPCLQTGTAFRTLTPFANNTYDVGTSSVRWRDGFFTRTVTVGDLRGTVETTTLTGTQNDFALASTTTILRCNNASALTFTGWDGEANGRIVVVKAVGAGTVKFTDQDIGSVVAQRFDTISNGGQILNTGGSAIVWYDSTDTKWKLDLIDPGAPITPTFAAGDFTANGSMTWTVDASPDVVTTAYQQWGKVLFFWFDVGQTDVGGTANNELRWTLPNGFSVAKQTNGFSINNDAGTGFTVAWWGGTATATYLSFTKNAAAGNWTLTTADNTNVRAQGNLEIQ